MSDEPRCPEEVDVGAYVLGTLEPAERARIAEHLERCDRCRSIRDDFAGLPGMLARIPAEVAASGPANPGEPAYRRLVDAAAHHRTVVRRRWAVAAAAAVLALVVGAGGVLWVNRSAAPLTVEGSSGSVRASVTVRQAETGSRLELTLAGVPSGQRCRLVAVGRDGHREVAGSWVASYAGAATIDGWSAASPDELEWLGIETFDGETLVGMPMRR